MENVKILWAVILKDLLIERKTKEMFSAMVMYAAAVLIIFHFAFRSFAGDAGTFSGGILWVAFTFSATLGLNRLYSHEQENGMMQAVALMPADKGMIFFGKCLTMLFWLTLTEWLTVPLFCVWFNVSVLNRLPQLFLVVFLGSLGYVAAGTLLSAVTVNTRMRENLLPLILFPVTIPLILSSVEATQILLNPAPAASITGWIAILTAFDVILLTGSYLMYGFLIEE